MASVAKRLRQRIVVPPLVGSTPIVRPEVTPNSQLECQLERQLLTKISLSNQCEIPRLEFGGSV